MKHIEAVYKAAMRKTSGVERNRVGAAITHTASSSLAEQNK